jgi:hypothetical protein
MSRPLTVVWTALEAAGCDPHGPAHDFRARCPLHDGENPSSLHVSPGADGRAVVWCHAHQCFIEDIVAALGLSMGDLFPAGHRHARRRQLAQANRADFHGNARTAVDALLALEKLGEPWRMEITTNCPYCGYQNAQLVVQSNPGYRPFLHCEAACTVRMYAEALAGLLEDREEAT